MQTADDEGGTFVSDDPRPPRRAHHVRPIVIDEPTIISMPEEQRPAAIAALARLLAEIINDEDFQARHRQRQRNTRQDDPQ